MSEKKRKNFSSEFKAKVALDAIRGGYRDTNRFSLVLRIATMQ